MTTAEAELNPPKISGGRLRKTTARIYSSDPFLWHVPRSARSGPGSGLAAIAMRPRTAGTGRRR